MHIAAGRARIVDARGTHRRHLVDPDQRVQRHMEALHTFELGAQTLLRRVHHYLRALTEQQPLDSDEAVKLVLINLPRKQFIGLPVIEEADSIPNVLVHALHHGEATANYNGFALVIPHDPGMMPAFIRPSPVSASMNSSQELLDHLSRHSSPYNDPLEAVDWAALSLDDFWIPEAAVSLFGTSEYAALDETRRKRLSQYEFLYFISGALWLEGLFMERIARISMHSAGRLDRLNYRLHELREEAGHSLMFIECMRRSGLSLPEHRFPKPRLATLVGRFAPFESSMFWIAVMIGEEVPDRMNRLIRQHRGQINPAVHDIVTTHMVDEARHMAHARDTLEGCLDRLPVWQKWAYRPLMRQVFRQFVHAFYYPTPDIYSLAGLPDGPDYRRIARHNPRRVDFIDTCVDPALRILRDQGLVLNWR